MICVREYSKAGKGIIIFIVLFIVAISSIAMANPIPYSFMSTTDYNEHQDVYVRSLVSCVRSEIEINGEVWINPYKTKSLEENARSNKLHYSWCQYINRMNDGNKVYFNDRSEAIAEGYVPCKACRP